MARFELSQLRTPIIQAPMAGGPSTPRLSAAVASAGGFGFLAAGYRTVEQLRADITELRALSDAPFGVNVFAPPGLEHDVASVAAYAARLAPLADRYGVSLGEPLHDDDGYLDKLELLVGEAVPVVSFAFGCPDRAVVERLHGAGIAVWVTVTSPDEGGIAAAVGADALIAQGLEAGGHRGSFEDGEAAGSSVGFGVLALLRLLRARTTVPLIAAGGIADGASLVATLAAGASAVQIGTALMLTPEAGTSDAHRRALRSDRPTALTRAFSGRLARGIINDFMVEHGAHAPSAYPDVHHLTAPLRAAARAAGDSEAFNLWAGQAHALARESPAAEIVADYVKMI